MGLLDLSYANAGSHEEAMSNIMTSAGLQDVEMLQGAQKYRQDLAEQRISMARTATREAQQQAARELGAFINKPGEYFNGDVTLGWKENYLTQLTPTSVATGAASRAAAHVAEMQDTLSLGVVKDLSDLMSQ